MNDDIQKQRQKLYDIANYWGLQVKISEAGEKSFAEKAAEDLASNKPVEPQKPEIVAKSEPDRFAIIKDLLSQIRVDLLCESSPTAILENISKAEESLEILEKQTAVRGTMVLSNATATGTGIDYSRLAKIAGIYDYIPVSNSKSTRYY